MSGQQATRPEPPTTFDSFECAIHKLAPACEQCVIGHGAEVNGKFYCCAHCARAAEGVEMHDRIGSHP